MFDDQSVPQAGQAGVPHNLPIGEPEDMFGEKDAPETTPFVAEAEPPKTAISAGVLRPAASSPVSEVLPSTAPAFSEAAPNTNVPTMNNEGMGQDLSPMAEPSFLKSVFAIVATLAALCILVGGGWWLYSSMHKTETPVTGAPTIDTTDTEQPPAESEPTIVESTSEETQQGQEDALLFGEPVDQDEDQLDTTQEGQYGTDPFNWDTDGDGLGDGDEALVWKTNPLLHDTDGDGYDDMREIRAGYSPTGPGRLFIPPSSTPQVAPTQAPVSSSTTVTSSGF